MKTHKHFATRLEALTAVYGKPQPRKWEIVKNRHFYVIRFKGHRWRKPESTTVDDKRVAP